MSKAEIVTSNLLSFPHGFSTRIGGVSTGVFDSLNLGMNRGDEKENVIKNWDIFLETCNIPNKSFVCGAQVHKNNVHIATKENLRPAFGPGKLIEADGYVTNEADVALAIFTADCVPVLLEDSTNKVIGAVHSGWRSTVLDIEKQSIDKMLQCGADLKNIKIAIGPAIDECCFEVGFEVRDGVISLLGEEAAKPFIIPKTNDKCHINLRGVVKERFIQLGISPKNIDIVGECTLCHPEKYWSHRYLSSNRGSQANVIYIPN